MTCQIGKRTVWLAALFAALACASTASAQVFTGRIDVTIEDSTGGRLPGVNVELTGPVNQVQVSDAQGLAHFLNLPVGIYAIKADIAGFNPYSNSTVQVVSGGSTPLSIKLAVAGTTETINVTAATPLIDIKRDTTTTNVSIEELQNIPSSRDPWVVMQTVPTVYMDRVNVGGAESGQQSNYNAKGAQDRDNTWSIDGVPVTDMGATGSSAFYYDFDSFQEMAITTGGADAQNPTGGVQLNMVLRKGTNTPHASARYYFENDALQAVNMSPELAAALGNTTGKGNRTDKYKDYGFDLGGPLLRDRVWIWGTMARTNINLLTLTGDLDKTTFKNWAIKADGQLNKSIRGNFTFYENNKEKSGRNVGPTRPPETAWNQTGPTQYYKGEGNFAAGSRLFASAKYAHVEGGFLLAPVGGLRQDYYIDDGGVAHNTFYLYQSARPQDYIGGDANYFAGKHEVKFGGAWRSTPVDHRSDLAGEPPDCQLGRLPEHVRPGRARLPGVHRREVLQHVRHRHDLTEPVDDHRRRPLRSPGVVARRRLGSRRPRHPDHAGAQRPGSRRASTSGATSRRASASPMPSTRIARRSCARSYAMFASQLRGDEAKFVSPIQYSYAYYNAVDQNSDGVAQIGEILFNQGLQGYSGFDPTDPARLSTVNTVDPNVKAPLTHELLFGVDREIVPNFAVSATFTWRRMLDLLWDPLTGVRSSDYNADRDADREPAGTFGTFTVPLYALRAAAVPAGGGQTETNREGYHQRYWGLEFSAVKRLSNKWMARFGFSTNDWREYFDDASVSIIDPTRAPAPAITQAREFVGPQVDGGLVVRRSAGSGKSNSIWSRRSIRSSPTARTRGRGG